MANMWFPGQALISIPIHVFKLCSSVAQKQRKSVAWHMHEVVDRQVQETHSVFQLWMTFSAPFMDGLPGLPLANRDIPLPDELSRTQTTTSTFLRLKPTWLFGIWCLNYFELIFVRIESALFSEAGRWLLWHGVQGQAQEPWKWRAWEWLAVEPANGQAA